MEQAPRRWSWARVGLHRKHSAPSIGEVWWLV